MKSEKIYPEPIDTLQKMYKEIVGRKLDEENTVYWLYRYGKPAKQITEVKSESAYLKSSIELDRLTGRSSKYFSKTEEMWARAFESYVSDKLKQKGIIDTYLVHSVNNIDYALFNPYLNNTIFIGANPEKYEKFSNKYYELYRSKPLKITSMVYDLINILDKVYDRIDGVYIPNKNELLNPYGFDGIDGRFRFLPNGLVERRLYVLQFKDGRKIILDTNQEFLNY